MASVEGERELWERIRRGDAEAFGGFYRQHAARLQAFLRRHLGDGKAAEDVAQEAFLHHVS
jgi:DNA-directed RNA polymerase specialized sigma24 family protein